MHCSIYFEKDSKYLDVTELVDFMSNVFVPEYESMINDLLGEEIENARPSQVNLLVCNFPLIMQKYSDLMLSMDTEHDVLLRYMLKYSDIIENKFGAIEEKIEKLKETCEISDNSRISGIFQKLSNEDMINELNFNDLDNELLVKSNSETNKYVNSTQAFTRKIQSLSYSRKKSNRIASKNSITQNSIALYSTWDLFINKVMSSKMIKEECVKINQILSDEIFSCLTKK